MSATTKELLKKVRMIVPPMLDKFHKGQLGRVAVIGGSESYTGAPYFSAMASARLGSYTHPGIHALLSSDLHSSTGADLSHVICTRPAANVIKTYSPNLMVHPIMREINEVPASHEPAADLASPIINMLSNLHAVVIGPGLGRDKLMQATVAVVIKAAREKNVPLVLDADALWLIQGQPELVHGYKECVLTPNVIEFGRLAKAVGLGEDDLPDTGEAGCKKLANALGGVLVVRKGWVDWISDGEKAIVGDGQGGKKRSGGQGDTLTGSIGTLLAYRDVYHQKLWDTEGNMNRSETLMLAAWGGSTITRECSRLAYQKHGRSLQASDLTEEVSVAFDTLIGEKEESKL